jgi:hypothetical protein
MGTADVALITNFHKNAGASRSAPVGQPRVCQAAKEGSVADIIPSMWQHDSLPFSQ